MGTIKLEGDPPFDVVAQSAASEAKDDTVAVTFRISNPGGQPPVVSLRVRMTPEVAHSVGQQMTTNAGTAKRWANQSPTTDAVLTSGRCGP